MISLQIKNETIPWKISVVKFREENHHYVIDFNDETQYYVLVANFGE